MIRVLAGVARITATAVGSVATKSRTLPKNVVRAVGIAPCSKQFCTFLTRSTTEKALLANPHITKIANDIVSRDLTKFSFRKGKRKSVKAVLKRFYRLNWGGWIRTKCGRHKRLWKKSPPRKRRLRQHVFCNAQQSYLLDKMVGSYWRKPKYYVDDPYEPYHNRDEWQYTYTKPKPYFPPEQ